MFVRSTRSVQDESWITEDQSMAGQSTALNPEDKDLGHFLLNKDRECRTTVYKILWEGQNLLASNLQECLAQVQAGGSMSRSWNRSRGIKVPATLEHLQLQ